MPKKKAVRRVSVGREIADQVFELRQRSLARRKKAIAAHLKRSRGKGRAVPAQALKAAAAQLTLGYLVAAGDSWFDYPGEFPLQHDDIITLLEEKGYTIESSAHAGDPIEAMAYDGGGQIYKLARCFEKIAQQGGAPKAVLLSGGGDDIAGDEFGMLLNNAQSKIGGWNDEVLDGVINQRIFTSYQTMLDAITQLSKKYVGNAIPILIHGYDYAVPDGRGYMGGWWALPGPWLQPGFTEKQFTQLPVSTEMIRDIMDRFNEMLKKVAAQYANVHYIDLRGTLSNSLPRDAYKTWWANELHPTPKGFKLVADKFSKALDGL